MDNDNIKAAFDATDYFIQQNYRKIAFIGGNKELFVSQDRYEGYKEALQKQGFLSMKNWFISHLVLCWKTILIK